MTIDFQAIKDIVLITVPIITAYLTYRSNKKSKKELNDELEVRLREQDNETANEIKKMQKQMEVRNMESSWDSSTPTTQKYLEEVGHKRCGNVMNLQSLIPPVRWEVEQSYDLGELKMIREMLLKIELPFDEEQPQIFCENQISIQMLSEVPSYSDFNPFDGEVHLIPCNQYYPDVMDLPGSFYYHGYWINKNWFEKYKNIFLEEFSFPEVKDVRNLTYLNEIETSNSVSIHVRRKDYVTLNWAWNFNQYHSLTSAFTHNRSGNYHLFVFSDDIEWCKEHSTELGFYHFHEITYIEGNTDRQNYIDMQLMSSCKAMIISNSSFCYLAALLNTKKNYVLNATSREII